MGWHQGILNAFIPFMYTPCCKKESTIMSLAHKANGFPNLFALASETFTANFRIDRKHTESSPVSCWAEIIKFVQLQIVLLHGCISQ